MLPFLSYRCCIALYVGFHVMSCVSSVQSTVHACILCVSQASLGLGTGQLAPYLINQWQGYLFFIRACFSVTTLPCLWLSARAISHFACVFAARDYLEPPRGSLVR
ncbi:hypothetical protein EDB81DRAFT_65692 [Dactylonectria macrodidyma]|uniref:Uncharacterized protein n=1 Tax=Dactylonectria macrodidyma TaxID=307937 RepID=A0A9P9J3L5_9HYPO|nr:hypothetical protein EDB81DRAFT_65692 [Dactylonectria macrodidyma]